jgi:hypothetical protein
MPKIALLAAPLLLTLPAAMWASQEPGTAGPQVCGEIRSVFEMTDAEAQAYQRQNLQHVKLGMSQAREHVAKLSQARRAELRGATAYVIEHCPYTRATIELVQLMRDSAHEATAREAKSTGCSVENAPLTLLVGTLDEHWSLLEDIGAVLPPVEGACQAGTHTRFEALYATLNAMNERVGALDDETRARLSTSNAVAARETANMWHSKPTLMDYKKWMIKADDTATNPTLAAACKSFGHAMKMYMTLGC